MSAELLRLVASLAMIGGVHDTPKSPLAQETPPPFTVPTSCAENGVTIELSDQGKNFFDDNHSWNVTFIREIGGHLDPGETLTHLYGNTTESRYVDISRQWQDAFNPQWNQERRKFTLPVQVAPGTNPANAKTAFGKSVWETITAACGGTEDEPVLPVPANAEAATIAPAAQAEQPAITPQNEMGAGPGPAPKPTSIPEPQPVLPGELKKFSDMIDERMPKEILWALGIATLALATGAFAFFRTQFKEMAPINFGKKIDFGKDEKKPPRPPVSPPPPTENSNIPASDSWQARAAENKAAQDLYAADQGKSSSLDQVRANLSAQRDADLLANEEYVSNIMGVKPKSLDELR